MLDFGYRSRCCYAAIRMGTKKVKGTTVTKKVWICCQCKKKDVQIVQYTGPNGPASTPSNRGTVKFAEDVTDETDLDNPNEDDS